MGKTRFSLSRTLDNVKIRIFYIDYDTTDINNVDIGDSLRFFSYAFNFTEDELISIAEEVIDTIDVLKNFVGDISGNYNLRKKLVADGGTNWNLVNTSKNNFTPFLTFSTLQSEEPTHIFYGDRITMEIPRGDEIYQYTKEGIENSPIKGIHLFWGKIGDDNVPHSTRPLKNDIVSNTRVNYLEKTADVWELKTNGQIVSFVPYSEFVADIDGTYKVHFRIDGPKDTFKDGDKQCVPVFNGENCILAYTEYNDGIHQIPYIKRLGSEIYASDLDNIGGINTISHPDTPIQILDISSSNIHRGVLDNDLINHKYLSGNLKLTFARAVSDNIEYITLYWGEQVTPVTDPVTYKKLTTSMAFIKQLPVSDNISTVSTQYEFNVNLDDIPIPKYWDTSNSKYKTPTTLLPSQMRMKKPTRSMEKMSMRHLTCPWYPKYRGN